nr:hypothetical protein [Tanacetum cinerariifolium]
NIESSSNSEGITAIVRKLDNLSRDMKKLKENVHAIQVGCQNCGGTHLDKDCPLNKEVKSVKEAKYDEFKRFHLSVMELSASVNVIPKSMFEHLKLAHLKKTDMLVEMADMMKRSPIGIVENVLVKIDKFLFPSDFVVMDINIESSSNSERITAIVRKLDNLSRDMKKLKENVHAIQVGCQNYGGTHLDKDCPLNKEVKSVKEANYDEFKRFHLSVMELSTM